MKLDWIEQDYILAINRAETPDEAHELSIGLREYQELYKVSSDVDISRRGTRNTE